FSKIRMAIETGPDGNVQALEVKYSFTTGKGKNATKTTCKIRIDVTAVNQGLQIDFPDFSDYQTIETDETGGIKTGEEEAS
ncbi:MAG: hypothetical protein Q4C25_06960, partial [Bacillota bacterium]|nr:hypothetical protein [Bacillota bacterium]